MIKCKIVIGILLLFEYLNLVRSNNIGKNICDNYDEPNKILEKILLNSNSINRNKLLFTNNTIISRQIFNNNDYKDNNNKISDRKLRYYTNLDPSDCRIILLRKKNIKIFKDSINMMESYDRSIQLLDILSSRRSCPYCKGCNDIRLNSLPIWIPPILHRKIKKINEQLDYKLCFILKKDTRIYKNIKEILSLIRDNMKIKDGFSNDIMNFVYKMKDIRRNDLPLYLLIDILDLIFEELRMVGKKLNSCDPSQFLFKCSWHPNKQNIEILSKLKIVTDSFKDIINNLELENESLFNNDRNYKIRFTRKNNNIFVLNRDILKIPANINMHGSCISSSTGISSSMGSNLSSSLSSLSSSQSSSLIGSSVSSSKDSISPSSSLPSFSSKSSISNKNICDPPFFDSIIIKNDGRLNNKIHVCNFELDEKQKKELNRNSDILYDINYSNVNMHNNRKLNIIQGIPYINELAAIHYDYASSSSNSKLLSWSEGIMYPKSVQSSNPDSYLLIPCNKPMWFIIGFQEDIFIEYVALFSLEYFSSSYQDIEISGSLVYPSKQWIPIGILHRNEKLSKEMFDIKSLCMKEDKFNLRNDDEDDHIVEDVNSNYNNKNNIDSINIIGKNDNHQKNYNYQDNMNRINNQNNHNLNNNNLNNIQNDNQDNIQGDYSNERDIKHNNHHNLKDNVILQDSNPCWVRYIKVRAISHYEEGHYYCHLTRIQIFGNNVINRLEVEMNGNRRSSISINEGEESVKDVEHRLWNRDLNINEDIQDSKSSILYMNNTNINYNDDNNILNKNKIISRTLKTQDKIFSIKNEDFDDDINIINNYRTNNNNNNHPLLSFIERVKILEKQFDSIKFEKRAIINNFNSTITSINDSILRLSNSVKFLQDILLDSNINSTNNDLNRIHVLKDKNNHQILLVFEKILNKLLQNYASNFALKYFSELFKRVTYSLFHFTSYIIDHFSSFIIIIVITLLFLIQILLFKQLHSVKKRLHNTLQFIKSCSNNTSPKNNILLDESFYFQKNLKLHSNPVTNSLRNGNISNNMNGNNLIYQNSEYLIKSYISSNPNNNINKNNSSNTNRDSDIDNNEILSKNTKIDNHETLANLDNQNKNIIIRDNV